MGTPSTPHLPGAAPSSRFLHAWALLAAILTLLGVALAFDRHDTYQAVDKRERARLIERTNTVEANLSRRLQTTSNALDTLREDLPWLLAQPQGEILLERRLKATVDSSFGLRSMLLVDRSGMARFASRKELVGLDFHKEERFQTIKAGNDRTMLYISAPFRTPLGIYTIGLGKVLQTASGQFDGYVLAILDPQYFHILMRSVLEEPDICACMLHEDGKVILRLPDTEKITGGDFNAKTNAAFRQHLSGSKALSLFLDPGPMAGSQRLFAMHTIRPLTSPANKALAFAISRDSAALYAPWRRETALRLGFFCVLGAVSALGLAAYQRRRRAHDLDREQAQAKLRQSHELLDMAERAAGAGAWDWDMRTQALSWSEPLYRLFGLAPGSPASFEVWESAVHPEDFPETRERLEQSIRVRMPFYASYRILLPDGGERWIDAHGLPSYDADGTPAHFSGLCIDVTERRQANRRLFESEQRFRELFIHLPIAYQSLDIAGCWLDANQKMADLLGFETPQQMVGLDFSTSWEKSFRIHFEAAYDEFKRKHSVKGEIQLVRRDGRVISVLISGRIQRDKEGKFLRSHCIVIDISERRAMEDAVRVRNADLERKVAERTAELQQHKEHLEETVLERTRDLAAARDLAVSANRAKSELLANVGHELRTPLNHVIGINGILRKEVQSDRGRVFLDKERESANKLLRLLSNLLDTAALESSTLQLEDTDFDLGALLARVEREARAPILAKGLTFERDVDDCLPQWLHGDAPRLAQVLDELLDNAVKFSSAGPVTLRVKQAVVSGHLVTLRFEVEDRGIGIAQALQTDMFDLFTQADGSSTRKFGGTGLGLARCKRIVSLMAGDIGVESVPGRGSLFWFEVRLTRVDNPPVAPAPADWSSSVNVMKEVLALLRAQDTAAQGLWKTESPRVGDLMGDLRAPFEDFLDSYDYQTAADLLDIVLTSKRI